MKRSGRKVVARNRKARHEFFIEETFEAGIVLKGTEVKSIRNGQLSIQESYASIHEGEVFINSLHISPYKQGNIQNVDPLRERKLLLNKREIEKMLVETTQKGKTLIPLAVHLRNGMVKVEIAVAKGKKLYDKRRDIAEKDAKRRMKQQASEKYL